MVVPEARIYVPVWELYEALQKSHRNKNDLTSPRYTKEPNSVIKTPSSSSLHSRQLWNIAETLQYLCALDEVEVSHPHAAYRLSVDARIILRDTLGKVDYFVALSFHIFIQFPVRFIQKKISK